MNFTRFLLIGLLLISLSCSNEDEIGPVNFELQVADNYIFEGAQSWVFFHNQNGDILDYKKISNGQIYSFSSLGNEQNKVSVSVINISPTQYMQAKTFLRIPIPSKWNLILEESWGRGCNAALGEVSFAIVDENLNSNSETISLSDGIIEYQSEVYRIAPNEIRFPSQTIYKDCEDNYFLTAMDKENNAFYKFIEKPSPGSYFEYSLSDFAAFEKSFEVNLPTNSSSWIKIESFESEEAYPNYIYNLTYQDQQTSLIAHYSSIFPKYRTSFNYQVNDGFINFEKLGGIPSNMTLPNDLSSTIDGRYFPDLVLTASQDYKMSVADYSSSFGDLYVDWKVFAESGNDFKNPKEFPSEFLNSTTSFSIDDVRLLAVDFYTEHESYSELINNTFVTVSKPNEYQRIKKRFF